MVFAVPRALAARGKSTEYSTMTLIAMPALTSEQLDIVQKAASHVPPAWRQRFMDAVTDQLMGRAATISNAELIQVTGAPPGHDTGHRAGRAGRR